MLTKTLIAGSTGLLLAVPAAVAANDDRAEVSRSGQCSGTATWKLTAKERDGGVELEFEVDSNVAGQTWEYSLSGPSGPIRSGQATTAGPSGSFSVEAATAGSAADPFEATASHAGQSCDTSGGSPAPSSPTGSPSPSTPSSGPGAEPGDDNGGSGAEPGDENGGSAAEPGDDNGSGADSQRKRLRRSGVCSATSEVELKIRKRARVRVVEIEVDSDRRGQKWSYRIKRGSKVVSRGVGRTAGRSGSFSVEVRVAGKGAITARAKNRSGGEVCTVGR